MRMRLFLAALLFSTSALAANPAQRVVYDVGDGGARFARSAVTNVENQLAAAKGTPVDIVMVLHGRGVDLLREAKEDPDLRHRIMALKREGVHLRVGAGSIARQHLDYRTDLFDVAPGDIVPNAIAELVRLQERGFVYVKP